MKTRILKIGYSFFPEKRSWYDLRWVAISDKQYIDDLEMIDEVYADDIIGPACALALVQRYAKQHGGVCIGTVELKPKPEKPSKIKLFLRKHFRGNDGVPGMTGAMGMEGAPGRSFHDLECPNCHRYRTDYPYQDLKLTPNLTGRYFVYFCNKCKKNSKWENCFGILLEKRNILPTRGTHAKRIASRTGRQLS